MFTFFGLFTDAVVDSVPLQISEIWPDIRVTRIEEPILALAIRFNQDRYRPEDEDTPVDIVRAVERLSRDNLSARFLLLRTECSSGRCANWGQIIQNGSTIFVAEGDGALRRLIKQWGVDIGPQEVFGPLTRDFAWS